MSRTKRIYDIGPDLSYEYAQNQEALDHQFFQSMGQVKSSSLIDVTTPFSQDELVVLFQTGRSNKMTAWIAPPKQYYNKQTNLFTTQSAPSTGNDEMHQMHMQKIDDMIGVSERKVDKEELTLEKTESGKLMQFFGCLTNLDIDIMHIGNERGRHHKG